MEGGDLSSFGVDLREITSRYRHFNVSAMASSDLLPCQGKHRVLVKPRP